MTVTRICNLGCSVCQSREHLCHCIDDSYKDLQSLVNMYAIALMTVTRICNLGCSALMTVARICNLGCSVCSVVNMYAIALMTVTRKTIIRRTPLFIQPRVLFNDLFEGAVLLAVRPAVNICCWGVWARLCSWGGAPPFCFELCVLRAKNDDSYKDVQPWMLSIHDSYKDLQSLLNMYAIALMTVTRMCNLGCSALMTDTKICNLS